MGQRIPSDPLAGAAGRDRPEGRRTLPEQVVERRAMGHDVGLLDRRVELVRVSPQAPTTRSY
jgi:hypothetical protein